MVSDTASLWRLATVKCMHEFVRFAIALSFMLHLSVGTHAQTQIPLERLESLADCSQDLSARASNGIETDAEPVVSVDSGTTYAFVSNFDNPAEASVSNPNASSSTANEMTAIASLDNDSQSSIELYQEAIADSDEDTVAWTTGEFTTAKAWSSWKVNGYFYDDHWIETTLTLRRTGHWLTGGIGEGVYQDVWGRVLVGDTEVYYWYDNEYMGWYIWGIGSDLWGTYLVEEEVYDSEFVLQFQQVVSVNDIFQILIKQYGGGSVGVSDGGSAVTNGGHEAIVDVNLYAGELD